MKANGQLHAPADLSSANKPCYPGRPNEEKKSNSNWLSNPRPQLEVVFAEILRDKSELVFT
jgi:hypothetical protein